MFISVLKKYKCNSVEYFGTSKTSLYDANMYLPQHQLQLAHAPPVHIWKKCDTAPPRQCKRSVQIHQDIQMVLDCPGCPCVVCDWTQDCVSANDGCPRSLPPNGTDCESTLRTCNVCPSEIDCETYEVDKRLNSIWGGFPKNVFFISNVTHNFAYLLCLL